MSACPTCGASDELRTPEQNKKLWPMLTDISRQVDWYGQKLTPWDWKDVFTAALRKAKVVPGLDGGFVVCGLHTSRMSKREMSDLLELMMAFGNEHGVQWTDPEWIAQMKEYEREAA